MFFRGVRCFLSFFPSFFWGAMISLCSPRLVKFLVTPFSASRHFPSPPVHCALRSTRLHTAMLARRLVHRLPYARLDRMGVKAAPRALLCTQSDQKSKQSTGMTTRHAGGVPDFIHQWGPGPFKKTGVGLIGLTVGSFGLAFTHEVGHIFPVLLSCATAGYWALGLKDLAQTNQALRRNFPVLIHFRYILESIRPEIQQYLIESDEDAVPFSREMRSIVYQRYAAHPLLFSPALLSAWLRLDCLWLQIQGAARHARSGYEA